MPKVVVVGLSHHTAPVEVRERLALSPGDYPAAVARLSGAAGVREGVVLSTCNRSELYALADDAAAGAAALEGVLRELAAGRGEVRDDYLYRLEGAAAFQHLFRVASSLDSLVVGEPQILGQVKDAFKVAGESHAVGPVLDRLFRQAFEVGKRVRSETEIGAYAVSVSFAAVELAKKIFGRLDGRIALIVGAGEMGELTMRHLKSSGVSELWVANRTRAGAEALAAELGGRALGLDTLEEALLRADIVISSTGAVEPVIRRGPVERAMKERRNRPLFLIDIAVPRDIEATCGDLYNVFLYNIDDLAKVVEGNRERRAQEAEHAQAIVNEEVARFQHWFEGLDAVPTIVALRERLEELRAEETERFMHKLGHLSERDRKLVQQYGETLVHKMLHAPMSQLRHAGAGEGAMLLAGAVRLLFRLDEPLHPGKPGAAGPGPAAGAGPGAGQGADGEHERGAQGDAASGSAADDR